MMGDLGKLIVAKGFKNLPKVQKIARSGHTETKLLELDSGYSTIVNYNSVVYLLTR